MSRTLTYAPGKGLVGLVWQTGEVLWSADAANDARVAMKGGASSTWSPRTPSMVPPIG